MFAMFRRWRDDKHRRIYKFWDGSRTRRADPVDIFFRLQAHPVFNAAVHCKLCDEGDREATVITGAAVREVFGVDGYDPQTGRGLTLGEQLGLLLDFYAYIDTQKKSINSSPTSPSNTEASTSPGSMDATTSCSSGCGPACSEPIPDGATPSG